MKKILILLLGFVLLSGSVYAAEYTAQDKKIFYDNFLVGMFWGMEKSLMANNVPKSKVTTYVNAMKKRVNRKELESQTWTCVSKYTQAQLMTQSDKISDECFDKWANNFYLKNQDLLKLLK